MINSDQKVAKVAPKFYCEICDYGCSKKYNFDKHLLSLKHKKSENMTNSDQNMINSDQKVAKVANEEENYICECGKKYKHKRSLWYHQTTCNYEPKCEEINNNNSGITNEALQIIEKKDKQIETLINKIIEIAPQMGNNNNNNTINNNQSFNINVFLNEECKDAMNMSDFIKSIEVSLEQLDYTTHNGLEKGITKVIMENMSKLNVNERPIHCTDTKRETLYIKDDDKWEKDKDKTKIKAAIKKASGKNYEALKEWTDENPDFMESDDKQLFYAHSISKLGKPISGVEDKIIKTLCNNTYVKDDI
tara:strand:+ start:413 stop:1327 length:915 start_codon:yes stop_codon:yes gene_type:complete